MPDPTPTNPPKTQAKIKEFEPQIGPFAYQQRIEGGEYVPVEIDAIVKGNDLKVTGRTIPSCDLLGGDPKITAELCYLDPTVPGTQYDQVSCSGNTWSVEIPGADIANADLYYLTVSHSETSGYTGTNTEQFTPNAPI